MKRDPVFDEIKNLLTEQRNPRTERIDRVSIKEALRLINEEDKTVAYVVEKAIPDIAEAVKIYVHTVKNGGRVFYIGAGTSGRLGVLDAAELPPTYGTPYWMVQGLIAGGYGALVRAVEGAEDYKENGIKDLKERGVNKKDFVIGLQPLKELLMLLERLNMQKKRLDVKLHLLLPFPEKTWISKWTCLFRSQLDQRWLWDLQG